MSIEILFLARRLPCTLPRLWIFSARICGRSLVGSPWEAGGPFRASPRRGRRRRALPPSPVPWPLQFSLLWPPPSPAPALAAPSQGWLAPCAPTQRLAPHRTAPHHHRGTTAPVSSLLVLCVPSPPRPPLVPRPPRCSLPLPPPSARPRARVWTPSSPAFPPVSLTWHRIACILRLPVLPFPACTFLDPALQSPASKRLVAA